MNTSFLGAIDRIEHPIAICGKRPYWYEDSGRPSYPALAPKIGFFTDWKNGLLADAGYVREFDRQVLQRLDPKKVFEDLCAIYPGVRESEITLLCYEAPGKFCHRHLVSAWLTANGFPCKELKL